MPVWLPFVVLLVLIGASILYLHIILKDEDDLKARPPAAKAPRPTAPRAKPAPPARKPATVQRPAGQVPAAQREGSGLAAEGAGLLRVLDRGPNLQRQAAAQGLGLAFAGTENIEVAGPLADIVFSEDYVPEARAECYCALRTVMGLPLEPEAEEALKESFPEGLDWAWLDALDVAISGSG